MTIPLGITDRLTTIAHRPFRQPSGKEGTQLGQISSQAVRTPRRGGQADQEGRSLVWVFLSASPPSPPHLPELLTRSTARVGSQEFTENPQLRRCPAASTQGKAWSAQGRAWEALTPRGRLAELRGARRQPVAGRALQTPPCSGKCEASVCCSGEPRSPKPFVPSESPLGRPVPHPCLWQGGEVSGCGWETEEELPHPLRTSVLCPAGPGPGLETLKSPHLWIQVRSL